MNPLSSHENSAQPLFFVFYFLAPSNRERIVKRKEGRKDKGQEGGSESIFPNETILYGRVRLFEPLLLTTYVLDLVARAAPPFVTNTHANVTRNLLPVVAVDALPNLAPPSSAKRRGTRKKIFKSLHEHTPVE